MKDVNNGRAVYLGIAFVVLGLLSNKWLIEIALTSDGAIESPGIIAAIYSLQTILIASGAFLLVKRPFIRVKRPGKAELVLFGSTLVMALVLAEFAARIVLPPTITYEETVEVSLFAPERLFPPNLNLHYDIRGLYEGAEEVNLRTSANRLISPEPDSPARHNVLFIGGEYHRGAVCSRKPTMGRPLERAGKAGRVQRGAVRGQRSGQILHFRVPDEREGV